MRYAIIGTGAIGGYYGARLAEAGHEVHFLFHSEYDAVVKNGLQVNSVNGDIHLSNVNAYNDVTKMPKCDAVIVAMKTTSERLLTEMLPHVCADGAVVSLFQNGLGYEELVYDAIKDKVKNVTMTGGMAFICSSRTAPGVISHYDFGSVTLSPLDTPEADTEKVKLIVEQLKASNVPAKYDGNLKERRWNKLLWNIPYNGMCVILNTSTDKLMQDPSSRALIRDVMVEVTEGAAACGVPMAENAVDAMMKYTDSMTPYAPSMKLDFDNCREMEIQGIYTNPIIAARECGCHMKKVEMMEQQLRFIQAQYLNK